MSRSGYSDDLDTKELNCWRGAVRSAMRGKRGQSFLREMIESLDAMPERKLSASVLVADGECCAMGAVAIHRGIDTEGVDPDDSEDVGNLFGISRAMAAEIAFENDCDFAYNELSPRERWVKMHKWANGWLIKVDR